MRSVLFALCIAAMASGCIDTEPEYAGAGVGGANLNDRTNSVDGELLIRGSMSVSSEGRFVVLNDETTTIVDLQTRARHVRDEQWSRVVFGVGEDARAVAYVSRPGYDGLAAIDLESGTELWSILPAYYNPAGAQFFRMAQDGKLLLVGDVRRVFRIATKDGDILGTSSVGEFPQFATLSPSGTRLLVVSETTWSSDTEPHTPVTSVDLESGASFTIDVPNCAAPPAILPDDSRVLLSPTFCQRGVSFEAQAQGGLSLGIDPVSVIDMAASGALSFRRNLPGFGPVTLSHDGTLAVAFLDSMRLDPALFDDSAQLPAAGSDRYHLMLIDPRAETFTLEPIGADLPRFAFSADGRKLLVDSTVVAQRRITLFSFERSEQGVGVAFFKTTPASSLLGVFDLESRAFHPVSGPRTSLDSFVQLPDEHTVITLSNTGNPEGRLGVLDLETHTVRNADAQARDLTLLPDGRVLLRRGDELCVTRDLGACE